MIRHGAADTATPPPIAALCRWPLACTQDAAVVATACATPALIRCEGLNGGSDPRRELQATDTPSLNAAGDASGALPGVREVAISPVRDC